jgi:hypothetical protein
MGICEVEVVETNVGDIVDISAGLVGNTGLERGNTSVNVVTVVIDKTGNVDVGDKDESAVGEINIWDAVGIITGELVNLRPGEIVETNICDDKEDTVVVNVELKIDVEFDPNI